MLKRRRKVLNFQQKVEILQRLEAGETGRLLAKEYGIGTSTISDIRRNSESIMKYVSTMDFQISERKTRKTAQNTDLDSKVFRWYLEEKNKGISPADVLICSKALELNQQLPNTSQNFKASNGWLKLFKDRHGIQDQKDPLEKKFCPTKQLRNFLIRERFILEKVYIVDEIVLHWKSLPNSDNSSIFYVILCTNTNASHRLSPWVIGTEILSNTTEKHFNYHQVNTLSMSTSIFQIWFDEIFTKEMENRREDTSHLGNNLLIFDDAPWHPPPQILTKNHLEIEAFSILNHCDYFSILPIDLDLQQSFRSIYKKKFLEYLVNQEDFSTENFAIEYSVNDSLNLIQEAWESVPKTDILQSWGKLLSSPKSESDPPRDYISEIAKLCLKLPELSSCKINDLIQWVHSEKEDCTFEERDEEFCEELVKRFEEGPTSAMAFQSLETVVQWFEKQEECNETQLAILKQIQSLAASKMYHVKIEGEEEKDEKLFESDF